MPQLPAAAFHVSVARADALPRADLPEVAFAGRSNAGKSSAINAIVGKNRLAFVSKTPGRTQLINLFTVGDAGYLVDLPGYGYAAVPLPVRRQWGGLIERYLTRRTTLAGLVVISDIRHALTDLDRQLLAWFAPRELPVHILLSKSDKLSRSQAMQALLGVQAELAERAPQASAQLFSAPTRAGVEQARAVVAGWLGIAESDPGKERPSAKGEKSRGSNALIGIKAPAQGGEAGDDSSPSALEIENASQGSVK